MEKKVANSSSHKQLQTLHYMINKQKIIFALGCALAFVYSSAKNNDPGYPYTPVPFTSVKLTDTFWGQRLKASREVTIPLAFAKCEETGRYENFIKAANPSEEHVVKGFAFDDTDVYKTIEGASYLLQTYPDPKLESYIDSIIEIVAAAQEPDGYLYTPRTMNPAHPHHWAGPIRWYGEEEQSHELYNLGHMIEGAIAHYQATGKHNFLDIAIRYADCVCRELGPNEGQTVRVPGHQITEMALAKLYLVTGNRKYLDQAKFFLDRRGYTEYRSEYNQTHMPVTEQDEAVGHAVRAGYMYAGMADVAALTGDSAYIAAIDRIWDNITSKKYYITGGVGATSDGEAFDKNYRLPNMSAYCETCAQIANVYVNHRLFLLHGQSKYYDVLERTLYNALISGVSLDGGGFFYPNPLESRGQHQREPWFGCACCPSNICRFIPSVPGYIYAVRENEVYINLFVSNEAELEVNNKTVSLTQQTDYPWNGDIDITITKNKAGVFALKIRIPGWVQGQVTPNNLYSYCDGKELSYSIKVNGEETTGKLTDGYFTIHRKWEKGDHVEIHLDMEPRIVKADWKVEADRGRIAVERGPLVYCAEHPDNDFDVMSLIVPQKPILELKKQNNLLNGIYTLSTDVQTLSYKTDGHLTIDNATLTLIPYYAWAHRGSGNMLVWLPQETSATSPSRPATLASDSRIEASYETPALIAVNDKLTPLDENDRSIAYYHWWPRKARTEWLTYSFKQPTTISSSTVYWFDDEPWGDCRVPKSWRLYYTNEEKEWFLVENFSEYTNTKGKANKVQFKPVLATGLKLEVELPEENSSGIYEWEVE